MCTVVRAVILLRRPYYPFPARHMWQHLFVPLSGHDWLRQGVGMEVREAEEAGCQEAAKGRNPVG